MVLWEITLATAYFLGFRRTYRVALRIQRRIVGPRHPEIRQFLHRCPSLLDFGVPIVLLSIVIFVERFAGIVLVVDLWKSLKILTHYKIKWTTLMLPYVHSPTCVFPWLPLSMRWRSHSWSTLDMAGNHWDRTTLFTFGGSSPYNYLILVFFAINCIPIGSSSVSWIRMPCIFTQIFIPIMYSLSV